MTALALIFTLSCIGISETVYLIKKRLASEKPVCPMNEDCTVVLNSKYNKIFIIPNDIVGLFFYIISALITAFLLLDFEPANLLARFITVLTLIASLMSLIFVYLQWKVIKAWCVWCLMSATTSWLMALIVLTSIL